MLSHKGLIKYFFRTRKRRSKPILPRTRRWYPYGVFSLFLPHFSFRTKKHRILRLHITTTHLTDHFPFQSQSSFHHFSRNFSPEHFPNDRSVTLAEASWCSTLSLANNSTVNIDCICCMTMTPASIGISLMCSAIVEKVKS